MAGSFFRRCTKCSERTRLPEGARRCPTCGGMDTSWYYHLSFTDPATGKRRQPKRGGFPTRKAAQVAARKLLDKVDKGRVIDPSRMTVGDFLLNVWLPARRMEIGETTADGYEDNIRRYIVPRIGDDLLHAVKAPRLNWLYADVRAHGRLRGEGPLSNATVRHVHTIMHRAFEDAINWEYLDANPASRANPPSQSAVRDEGKASVRTWTAAQVHEFADFIAEQGKFFVLWLLAASTGMRRSELLGLRWQDVDFRRRQIAVRQVLIRIKGGARLKPAPKSAHGFRTIHVSDRVIEALRAHRKEQLEVRRQAEAEWEDHDLVFARQTPGPKGEPPGQWWHPDYVTKTIRELIAESGLPRIRPLQDLRHTHATVLLLGKEPTKTVQERLGHHSHHFTSDSYQHAIEAMDASAADAFDAAVFDQPSDDDEDGERDDQR